MAIRSQARSDGTGLPEYAEPCPTNRWRLLTAKFSNGERFPMLLDSRGMPDWNSTLFITTQVRNGARTPNTSISILSSIRILLTWAECQDHMLSERFQNGRFFTLQELESLRDFAQFGATTIADMSTKSTAETSKTKKPRRLESARAEIGVAGKRLQNQSLYIRLTYIARYLRWFALRSMESRQVQASEDIRLRLTSMVDTLLELRPRIHSRSGTKRGLSEEAISCLLNITDPASPQNPFEPSVRRRNLIISVLGSTGARGGELLGFKVTDFEFQGDELLIARRHGDPSDPRANQPVAKTKDRRLPICGLLSEAVFDYVLKERAAFRAAKKHPFLLVTHRAGPHQGLPLSKAGLEKIFATIRKAAPNVLKDLTPHLLRHTANDIFSRVAERNKLPSALEEKLRSYAMGWEEGSGTAARYTRRYLEEQAKQAMLELQQRWMGRKRK